MWANFSDKLSREVDGASLAVVRMVTAAALFVLAVGVLVTGRVPELFMSLGLHFQYPLATFVKPLPGNLPYAHMVIIALTAAAVFIGWRTRLCSVLLCAATLYWFLLDPLYYDDGYYLLALMSILVAWLPVNRWMSADRQLARETRTTVLGWQPWLVQMQLLFVYFFSGLSKLNGDWLSGAPLVERFALADAPVGAQTAIGIAWGVMLLQLSLGFLLLWRRSRGVGLVLMTVLHFADWMWLNIGVAPVMMWALSFVFCSPDWPRRIVARLAPTITQWPFLQSGWKVTRRIGGTVDAAFSWFDDSPVFKKTTTARRSGSQTPQPKTRSETMMGEATKYCVVAWLLLQFILPLRHFAYPGNSRWTDEGRLFAWWGETYDKQGDLSMTLILPDRQLMWTINPRSEFPVPLDIMFSQAELESRGLAGGMLQDIVLANDDEVMRDLVKVRIESAGLSPEDV
uniref:HTTM domain-containing protein n=1 Tax=Symmachiella dynata TaxID=2527995 RepID=UPI0030EE9619